MFKPTQIDVFFGWICVHVCLSHCRCVDDLQLNVLRLVNWIDEVVVGLLPLVGIDVELT